MIELSNFYEILKEKGVEFITGVPDTLLNDFCLGLDQHWSSQRHIIAANEGNAIALASGYHLATDTVPVVYMQNSGMGNAMNPLISLTDRQVYSIPLVMLIGWRGEPGNGDWPQHQRQGELSPVLLDALDIPYKILSEHEDDVLDAVAWATSTAKSTSAPTALLVRKNVLAKPEKAGFDSEQRSYPMSREDAIRAIVEHAPENALFVASTGRITRELHAIRESLGHTHDRDFLNVGAMGHTLSIATGIATAHPEKTVICLDGDAAALMHMGSMPVTANLNLPNLLHIVLNNGVHESVGGQPSVNFIADLTEIAQGAGYAASDHHITNTTELKDTLYSLLKRGRPGFIEFRVKKGMRSEVPILQFSLASSKKLIKSNLLSFKV